ncbi:unnamed protein product [Mytilus coruscus]|uniref:Uncharacterized protein n=1 Tax=Mytilus coruscus TaxID=42192 RepID=A0A6J8B1N2_MYTCO|nr:unnamed protein product [Mytilus coruscus]
MSELKKLLDSDHESLPSPSVHSLPDVNSAHQTGNKDLVDTFSLFKTYLDGNIATLHKDLAVSKEDFATKLKQEVSVKLKGEGNQIQNLKLVSSAIFKAKKHNKLIRIAYKSPTGWKTVREYESDDLASDSEDDKRVRFAESRAIRSIKEKKYLIVIKPLQLPFLLLLLQFPINNMFENKTINSRPFGPADGRNPHKMTSVTTATSLVTGELNDPFFNAKPVVPGTSRQQS